MSKTFEFTKNDCQMYAMAHPDGMPADWNQVYFKKGVTTVQAGALFALSASSIIIEEGIEKIEMAAFCRNIKLESIVLPLSLKELDLSAFDACPNLKVIACSHDIAEKILPALREKPGKEKFTDIVIAYDIKEKEGQETQKLLETQMFFTRSPNSGGNRINKTDKTIRVALVSVQKELNKKVKSSDIDLIRDFEKCLEEAKNGTSKTEEVLAR